MESSFVQAFRRPRVTGKRRGFAQRIQGLRHIGLQTIGTLQFYSGFASLALLQQRSSQTIGGLCVSRLHLVLGAKFFFSLRPLRRTGVDQAKFQMQFRSVGADPQRFEKFFFGLGHLAQHKIIFREGLMGSR